MKLGTKISKLRKEKNYSQAELAYKLDVAQTTISNIESGKTIPDFLFMEKICDEFDVSFDYFLDDNKIYHIKNNTGVAVGDNAIINIQASEGILENILKRIHVLENIINNAE